MVLANSGESGGARGGFSLTNALRNILRRDGNRII